jgi:hypothetical protein
LRQAYDYWQDQPGYIMAKPAAFYQKQPTRRPRFCMNCKATKDSIPKCFSKSE